MIHPVILCGGQGTRLWPPLSRKSYPKQFSALTDGDLSLFQATARRLSGQGFAPPVVMTSSDYRFIATQQLAEAGIDPPGAVLIEPDGRNTAPAVLAAALHLLATCDEDDPLMLVSPPSDHTIPDGLSFRAAVFQGGAKPARAGQLVTFGILPDRPETGYGYLELGNPPEHPGEVVALTRFVEKPDPRTAECMVASGKYLWNAGIFLFSARAIVDAFKAHASAIIAPVQPRWTRRSLILASCALTQRPGTRSKTSASTTRSWNAPTISSPCPMRVDGPIWAVGTRSGARASWTAPAP